MGDEQEGWKEGWLEPGWSYAQVPMAAVMGEHALSDRCLRVLLYLAWRAGGKGSAWPGTPAIAADLGVSKRTVQRALAELREKGWLGKE